MTLSLNEFLDNVIDNCSCVPACCRSPQRLLISAALRALGACVLFRVHIDPPPVSCGGPEHARVPSPPNPAAQYTAAVPLPADPSLELGQSVATAAYSLVSLMAVTSIAALGTAIRRPKFAGIGPAYLIRLA